MTPAAAAVAAGMDPVTPPLNPNPSPTVYQIGGVPVEFPYKPYGSQLAFMGRVISTLDRARRQGHCHALLESPTGTGKSLSLLCSSLAWQQQHRRRVLAEQPAADPSPPTIPIPDSLANGGGFIPEPEPSKNLEQPPKAPTKKAQKKLVVPTIYYASRTHSQIKQVIREYRKTSYRVPMAVLASRKHYCTNKHVCMKANVDEECKLLLKDTGVGCPHFKNANKVKSHPSLQKGGSHEAHDIEDLVRIGRTVKGCSYFASQTMATEAQLVFCPYSYIVSPIVRRAVDIDIKGSIIILDEAHNIEDMAREAGSLDVEEEILYTLQTELGQLCMGENVAGIYQPLYDMIQGIISWIGLRKNNLEQRGFEHYSSYWTGDKAMGELQQAGITQQCFPILQECATKAIKAASDVESKGECLSGISAVTLEELFSSLSYFFSGNGCHAFDYQLALKRYVKRDESNVASGWRCSLSLWCLNPAIVFKEISNLSLSVILTSGTLSPMGSFASELGVQFEACMEAPHVIDVDSQLWAAVISSGPGNCQLNASYKTADGYGFQDAIGTSLEEICKIVPGGALVFFPSYKLMEKLRARWYQTGQWSRLNAQKPIFVEPRGSMDDFEPVLKGYYDSILGNNKVGRRKSKPGLKRAHKHLSTEEFPLNPVKRGAAFLAVCRGKVSEGIDFSDENARVVVIVGIPFPNTNDIQVVVKKKYNDTYKSSKGLLSGNEWYCHQAFRALNQAAGRCIRHRFDYGAIILLDERLKEERNLVYVSKWLRKSIKHYDNFEESLEGLQAFFLDAEKRLGQKGKDMLQAELLTYDTKEKLPTSKQNLLNQQILQKKNQKSKRSRDQVAKASSPVTKDRASPAELKVQSNVDYKAVGETNEKSLYSYGECVDLESRFLKHNSRWSGTISIESSIDSFDEFPLVKNTAVDDQGASRIGNSMDVNSYSTAVRTWNQFPAPSFSLYSTLTHGNLPEDACSSPERVVVDVDFCIPGLESSVNTSVNSHNQRKRKPVDSRLNRCALMDRCSALDAESFCHVGCAGGRNISTETKERTDSHFADDCTKCKILEPMQGVLTEDNRNILPSSDDPSIEKKLHICCSSCKTSLGLRGDNFLVTCSLASLSKVYLSYVLKYGPTSTCLSDHLSKTRRTNTEIVISDVSSIDHLVLSKSAREGAPQLDIWSKEDGCVFRVVSCPFCTGSKICLGVQVMATDASNVHLLNKVLFYADHLDIRNEATSEEEATLHVCSNGARGFDIEKYAYSHHPKNSWILNDTKSKLKLPKKEQSASQFEDGANT